MATLTCIKEAGLMPEWGDSLGMIYFDGKIHACAQARRAVYLSKLHYTFDINGNIIDTITAPFDARAEVNISTLGGKITVIGGSATGLVDIWQFDPTIAGYTASSWTQIDSNFVPKIGNRVFYQFTVTYTSGTGTGFLRVTGLPFVNASGSGFNPPQTIAIQNITLSANHYVVGDCPQGQSRIDVYSQPTGGGATADVSYDASGDIYCSGQYFIA